MISTDDMQTAKLSQAFDLLSCSRQILQAYIESVTSNIISHEFTFMDNQIFFKYSILSAIKYFTKLSPNPFYLHFQTSEIIPKNF